ncbi:hypothetical protein [Maricaulis parjimensis]|uniref:hypothetical protein n=1 Tax=Maricaulis parjimensis TaxID=144023 RepID=UPI00193A1891|nr:hypothetical protein [Maricaulis parjimensis]
MAAILTVMGLLTAQTLSHARAGRIRALDNVALQQQLDQENFRVLGYPELLAVADHALHGMPERPEVAVSALERVLEIETRDGSSWARLAFAYAKSDGFWTDRASGALRESYLRMPYADQQFMLWRLGLAEHYWPSVPDALRQDVLREARLVRPGLVQREWPRIWESQAAHAGD